MRLRPPRGAHPPARPARLRSPRRRRAPARAGRLAPPAGCAPRSPQLGPPALPASCGSCGLLRRPAAPAGRAPASCLPAPLSAPERALIAPGPGPTAPEGRGRVVQPLAPQFPNPGVARPPPFRRHGRAGTRGTPAELLSQDGGQAPTGPPGGWFPTPRQAAAAARAAPGNLRYTTCCVCRGQRGHKLWTRLRGANHPQVPPLRRSRLSTPEMQQ